MCSLIAYLAIATVVLSEVNAAFNDTFGKKSALLTLPPVAITFFPERVDQLVENQFVTVYVNCTRSAFGFDNVDAIGVSIISVDPMIATVRGHGDNMPVICRFDNTSPTNESSFNVYGHFLGRTAFRVYIVNVSHMFERNSSSRIWQHVGDAEDYRVSVVRKERFIDHMFLGIVTLLVICANIGMGCKIELPVVKEVLTKPIAPIIGFCCQFIIMPLTSFGVLYLVGLSGGLALGYFATGCAPGGGSSNMYSFLLGGDVSLSVTMTLVSVTASLGMIPMWLFTLGQKLIDPETKIKIPFANIMISLACILLPVAVGVLIQRFWKRGAKFIVRCMRPFYIALILCMFTLGVWSNLYIFKLISWQMIVAGFMLPYLGFGLSGLVAFLLRQPRARVLTIAIETGIQNTGIPIILMKYSLPQPEADLSIIAPVVVAMFMPLPLWIAVTVVEIRRRCCKKPEKDTNSNGVAVHNETVENGLLNEKESKNGVVTLADHHVANGTNGDVKKDVVVSHVSSF